MTFFSSTGTSYVVGCTSYVVRRCTTLYVGFNRLGRRREFRCKIPDVEVEEAVGTDHTARIELDQFSELVLGRLERCVQRLLVE
jgi:hypothetical protein